MNKKIAFLPVILLFAANRASAQADAWLLQDGLTPQTLSSSGALLTDTDSMVWPDGRNVLVTYWLGVGDSVFRCAELTDGEAGVPSCWERAVAAESGAVSGTSVVRRISTRRRPLPLYGYREPHPIYPHVWVGAHR